jgi:hypothetical protein
MQILLVLNVNYDNKTIQTETIDWVDDIDDKQYREFKIICCCLSLLGFISDNTFIKLDSSIDGLYEIESVDLAYYHCIAKNALKLEKKYYNPQILIESNINYDLNLLNITPYAFLIRDEEKIIEEIKFG